MGRKKITVAGEHATRRLHFAITPRMERFLDAIALINQCDRTEIIRDLLADFINQYRERHADNQILKEIEDETATGAVDKSK
jgi:uncharacterized Zn finger protein